MNSKSGYRELDENEVMEERKLNNTVSIDEQETHIWFMRDEKHATIYTSDTTQMTRFDKLCNKSPEVYSLTKDTGRGKEYRCEDKTLVSSRSKKKEVSEEQKTAAAKRFKKYHAEKSSQNTFSTQ